MNAKTRRLMQELTRALSGAMADAEENGCTCVDRSNGHQRGCVGVNSTKDYAKTLSKAQRFLESEERKAKVCVCGPKDIPYRPAQKD
jgi:hypothetical protein